MLNLRIYLLLGTCLVSTITQAYIYDLEVWQRDNQTIYCLSDMHLNVGASPLIANRDTDQFKIIKGDLLGDIVKQCSHNKCKVLIEDSYEFLKNLATQNLSPHFLSNIAESFRLSSLPVINIETRNKRIVTLQYTLSFEELSNVKKERNYLEKEWKELEQEGEDFRYLSHRFAPKLLALNDREQLIKDRLEKNKEFNFPTKVIIEELENTIKEIEHYNDGPILNNYYQQTLHMINTHESLFKAMKAFPGRLNEFIEKNIDQEYAYIFVRGFAACAWQLLDLRVLHEIYNSNDQKIYIFAGGAHIEHITSLLPKLGYVKTVEKGSKKEAAIFMKDPYISYLKDIWDKKAPSAQEIRNSLMDLAYKQSDALEKIKPLDSSALKLMLVQ